MLSSLKRRIEKLHGNYVSQVTSVISVTKNDALIKKSIHGTNKNKVIHIIVKL